MRNYKKYRDGVIILFNFLHKGKITKEVLISALEAIEYNIDPKRSKISDKGLWFKFYKGDTGVTTLKDLYNDIGSSKNNVYIQKCIKTAIDNPKGLEIHYS